MSRRLPNLNQLRAFEAAARHLSFKDAADELNVTHAAVSHQIKALEEDLGQKLFHRMTRQVRLTSTGEIYLPSLTTALDAIAAATASLSDLPTTGTLRISIAPYYGSQWLFPRLPKFHALYPDLSIEASPSYKPVDFRKSDFDAALRYGAGGWPGLGEILLHGDQNGPVCAAAFAAGRSQPIPPEEIAEMPLVHTLREVGDWLDWLAAVGYTPRTALRTSIVEHRGTAIVRALSGNCVALIDTQITQADVDAGNLVRIHPMTIERPRGIYLVFPETDQPDPRLVCFADWIKDEVAKAKLLQPV